MFWRAGVYNLLVATHVFVTTLATLPYLLFQPRRRARDVAIWWADTSLRLLKAIVGIEVEVRGREHIPAGAAIVAAKHQSALETLALMRHLDDGVFVLKRELTLVPLFGWYLRRLNMIAIDRSAGGEALVEMLDQAGEAARRGRQIVIFPEGTRRAVGAPPRYKAGVAHLYGRLGLPCVPVAIDAGVFWPKGTLKWRQGRTVIEFLEPIPPGLDRPAFEAMLRDRIERATAKLVTEALGPSRTPTAGASKELPAI